MLRQIFTETISRSNCVKLQYLVTFCLNQRNNKLISLKLTCNIFYSFVPNPVPASTLQPNKCPDHGVISVSDRGRLGNLMSQYATLYAYSKLLDRQPVISQHMSNTLLKVFPSASIPSSSICKLHGVLILIQNSLALSLCRKSLMLMLNLCQASLIVNT